MFSKSFEQVTVHAQPNDGIGVDATGTTKQAGPLRKAPPQILLTYFFIYSPCKARVLPATWLPSQTRHSPSDGWFGGLPIGKMCDHTKPTSQFKLNSKVM